MRNPISRSIALGTLALFAIFAAASLFENLDAQEILVIQSIGGEITVHTDPGPKWQGFGKLTFYNKRSEFSFAAPRKTDDKDTPDRSLSVMFNEGGTARISGVISWEMPAAHDAIVKIHTKYRSQQAVEQQLIRPAIDRALYFTGSLMSSSEAYASRKPDLLRFLEDQAKNGIYQMETISVKQPDPITGVEKTVSIVQIALDNAGKPKRQSSSQIGDFGIVLMPPTIDSVVFEEKVRNQIAQQQANYMQTQTAKAEAVKAEQAAITAEQNGKAEAAKARWAQEVEKATAVTAAEKERDVAKLNVQTAEMNKQTAILEGQGEATKRQLIMNADGALDKKLAAYVETQKIWADAFAKHPNALVPSVVMGGSSTGNAATSFMDMLVVKAAKDLAVSTSAR